MADHAGHSALRVLRDDNARSLPKLAADATVLALLTRVLPSESRLEALRARIEALFRQAHDTPGEPGGTDVTLNAARVWGNISVGRCRAGGNPGIEGLSNTASSRQRRVCMMGAPLRLMPSVRPTTLDSCDATTRLGF
jgi:hypothetical protein